MVLHVMRVLLLVLHVCLQRVCYGVSCFGYGGVGGVVGEWVGVLDQGLKEWVVL